MATRPVVGSGYVDYVDGDRLLADARQRLPRRSWSRKQFQLGLRQKRWARNLSRWSRPGFIQYSNMSACCCCRRPLQQMGSQQNSCVVASWGFLNSLSLVNCQSFVGCLVFFDKYSCGAECIIIINCHSFGHMVVLISWWGDDFPEHQSHY